MDEIAHVLQRSSREGMMIELKEDSDLDLKVRENNGLLSGQESEDFSGKTSQELEELFETISPDLEE